jgi:hypothetical protein
MALQSASPVGRIDTCDLTACGLPGTGFPLTCQPSPPNLWMSCAKYSPILLPCQCTTANKGAGRVRVVGFGVGAHSCAMRMNGAPKMVLRVGPALELLLRAHIGGLWFVQDA